MKGKRVRLLLVVLTLAALSVTAISAGGPQPLYIEEPIHVPKNTSSNVYPNNVQDASDHGCDDWWAVWNSSNWNLPGGVWADNLLNQAHITLHNGLDGYFRCYDGGSCYTKLCSKHGGLYNAWSEKVRY